MSRVDHRKADHNCGSVSSARPLPPIRLAPPTARDATAFLEAVARSRALHGRWITPPATLLDYQRFLQRVRLPVHAGYLVRTGEGHLAGTVLITEIVRGAFASAYLGYYGFVPYDGQGFMRAGLARAIRLAFSRHGLHRLEANIQPENARSRALVSALGFRQEGYSPRYLKVGGRWRDHERWALTREDWRA